MVILEKIRKILSELMVLIQIWDNQIQKIMYGINYVILSFRLRIWNRKKIAVSNRVKMSHQVHGFTSGKI